MTALQRKTLRFRDPQPGCALVVRLGAHAAKDRVGTILADGTVEVNLVKQAENELNPALAAFLALSLGIDRTRVEIVAGQNGRDKLVTILGLDGDIVTQRIHALAARRSA
jgi:uncharacterized protein YggU (UPF0235/DUF167 family)